MKGVRDVELEDIRQLQAYSPAANGHGHAVAQDSTRQRATSSPRVPSGASRCPLLGRTEAARLWRRRVPSVPVGGVREPRWRAGAARPHRQDRLCHPALPLQAAARRHRPGPRPDSSAPAGEQPRRPGPSPRTATCSAASPSIQRVIFSPEDDPGTLVRPRVVRAIWRQPSGMSRDTTRAEGVGFEPTVGRTHNGFRGRSI